MARCSAFVGILGRDRPRDRDNQNTSGSEHDYDLTRSEQALVSKTVVGRSTPAQNTFASAPRHFDFQELGRDQQCFLASPRKTRPQELNTLGAKELLDQLSEDELDFEISELETDKPVLGSLEHNAPSRSGHEASDLDGGEGEEMCTETCVVDADAQADAAYKGVCAGRPIEHPIFERNIINGVFEVPPPSPAAPTNPDPVLVDTPAVEALSSIESTSATKRPRKRATNRKKSKDKDAAASVFSDIEDKRSPLERFRTFPCKPFSVSDLTAGAWCEQQYFYTLSLLPGGRKRQTQSMKAGTAIHARLEEEVHRKVKVEVKSREDAYGLRLWNVVQGLRALRDTGITREFEVWGVVDGNLATGVIDVLTHERPGGEEGDKPPIFPPRGKTIEAYFAPLQERTSVKPQTNKKVYIADVKTRWAAGLPSPSQERTTRVQLSLYHRFLSEMAAKKINYVETVFPRYALDPDAIFSDEMLAQMAAFLEEDMFSSVRSQEENGDWIKQTDDAQTDATDSSEQTCLGDDLLRYRTLRSLVPLLERELSLAFPNGAASLGDVLSVEYRRKVTSHPNASLDTPGLDCARVVVEEDTRIVGTFVFPVDEVALNEYLLRDMQWWKGERAPEGPGVEEAGYKCRRCEFVEHCEWRLKQHEDFSRKPKGKVS